jgi:hypothetical protein
VQKTVNLVKNGKKCQNEKIIIKAAPNQEKPTILKPFRILILPAKLYLRKRT